MSAVEQKLEADWVNPKNQLPPEGAVVWTMDSAGKVNTLLFAGRLWWFPDRSMYVYYVPKFWKPME